MLPRAPHFHSQIYTISHVDREDLDEDRTFYNFFHRLEQICGKALLLPPHYKLQYDFPGSPLLMNADFGVHDQVMIAFDKVRSEAMSLEVAIFAALCYFAPIFLYFRTTPP